MKITFPITAQQLTDFISQAIRGDKLIQFNFPQDYEVYSHKDLIIDYGSYYTFYCDGEYYTLTGEGNKGNKLVNLELVEDWDGNSQRIH